MPRDAQKVRGIYLFPNLLTTAGLFAAFYAIVASVKGQFETASIAIFVSMIMDALDGRIARLTNTESAFGMEYDSLADMVSFGVAPALLVYTYALQGLGKLGWLAAFIYTATVALRLARFNTQIGVYNKRYFQGLPCPAGAAVITSSVWLTMVYTEANRSLFVAIAFLAVIIGVLMVSNIRYVSFKDMDLKGRVPFFAMLIMILLLVGVAIDPPLMLFVAFCGYASSGPLLTLRRLRKNRVLRKSTQEQRRLKKQK